MFFLFYVFSCSTCERVLTLHKVYILLLGGPQSYHKHFPSFSTTFLTAPTHYITHLVELNTLSILCTVRIYVVHSTFYYIYRCHIYIKYWSIQLVPYNCMCSIPKSTYSTITFTNLPFTVISTSIFLWIEDPSALNLTFTFSSTYLSLHLHIFYPYIITPEYTQLSVPQSSKCPILYICPVCVFSVCMYEDIHTYIHTTHLRDVCGPTLLLMCSHLFKKDTDVR